MLSAAELDAKRKTLVRVDGQQILLLQTERGVAACPNRCPHEGYPLSEGELCESGTLRCHWHNWTFDLASGKTLVGGDTLLRYPVKVEGGRVLVVPQPDPAQLQRRALDGIATALDDADQQRLLRETARLELAGGDPLEAVRAALAWVAPRLQYGTTHAIAGAPDWLTLATEPGVAAERRLAALGEVLGHIADDGRRERRFPFGDGMRTWDAGAFLAAVEAGDEESGCALVRGALAASVPVADLVPVLATAALSHYADFGHSLIYVVKSAELIERLGERVAEPLLCLLVRSICYATREDLLPEFRAYGDALARWRTDAPAGAASRPPLLVRPGVGKALAAVVAWSQSYPPQEIFRTLVDSAAFALLHADERAFTTTSGAIAANVSWLDLTHAVTFAQAGELVARAQPELWPAVLLQIACFLGRSAEFVDADYAAELWQASDPHAKLAALRDALFDHGRDRFIISVHLVKTWFAAVRLIEAGQADPALVAAALERFFHAPIKGRHVIRTARQMLAVAAAG